MTIKTKTKAKKAKSPKGKAMKKKLPFKLSDAEKATRGLEAANLNNEIAVLTIQKKTVTDEFAGKIKDRTATRNLLLKQIHDGAEDREVECTEVKNFDKSQVEYWWNGEIKQTREMTEEDRQLEIPTAPAKAPKSAMRKAEGAEPKVLDMRKSDRDLDIAATHRAETSKNGSWSTVNGVR